MCNLAGNTETLTKVQQETERGVYPGTHVDAVLGLCQVSSWPKRGLYPDWIILLFRTSTVMMSFVVSTVLSSPCTLGFEIHELLNFFLEEFSNSNNAEPKFC